MPDQGIYVTEPTVNREDHSFARNGTDGKAEARQNLFLTRSVVEGQMEAVAAAQSMSR